MNEEKKEVSVTYVVKCGKIKHGGLVTMEECQECPHHKGMEKIMAGGNDLPNLFEIICGLPTQIRAVRLITGGLNAGTK